MIKFENGEEIKVNSQNLCLFSELFESLYVQESDLSQLILDPNIVSTEAFKQIYSWIEHEIVGKKFDFSFIKENIDQVCEILQASDFLNLDI